MPNVLLHGVHPQLHRALKSRAALNNRSVEAEILAILEDTVKFRASIGGGTDFLALVRGMGGIASPKPPSDTGSDPE